LCGVLIDTGAVHSNYINKDFVETLNENESYINMSSNKLNKVTAAFGSETISSGKIKLNLKIFSDINEFFLYDEEFVVVENLLHDVIIGLPCIRKHDLTLIFRDHFVDTLDETMALKDIVTYTSMSHPNSVKHPTIVDTRIFALGARVNKNVFLDPEYDDDEIDLYSEAPDFFNVSLKENKISNQNQNNKNNRNEAEQFEFNIFGSEQLQIRTKAILEEFSDIFDIKLRSQPAKIKPYELKVDKLKWEKPINRLPPRPQTLAKNNAIMKFIQQSLEIDLIEPSQSAHWSQLNLRPKKDPDEYRITCDFRNINLATELMKWPLPNIPAMLQRIGSKKAKYFAVLDLTAGYHQVPISVDSRDFTSFRTLDGLYKFKRLPMGLTNAAAYFQQMMVTVVLAGLIYSMLENYLDDLIIFGETEEEYLLRLTTVLGRLKQFDIVLNPKKCRFNLARVEYVGHVIDHEGLHFSEEKLNNMLLYEKPIYQRQLKSFLGLASYFRDHIKNHSILVYDLQRLIEPYNPKKKLFGLKKHQLGFLRFGPRWQNALNYFSLTKMPQLLFVLTHVIME
jgi:hypothetical protein